MKLVLAEKPSVAQSIAKVLKADKRCDGYLEGNNYVVSWCVVHLVELAQPENYDVKYTKWKYDDLPIIPTSWLYQVSSATNKQFKVIKKLMERNDIDGLICATDAGREGELIFRLVYHQCHCQKPFARLWISSMEDNAILDGFKNLKKSSEYDALYEAALCRERADWLIGINATRLFSCLYSQTLNIGRVMTPTLAMVVMREAQISAFQSVPFYTLQLSFDSFNASSQRMDSKDDCEKLRQSCLESKTATVVQVDKKNKQEKAPLLYDLTSLQREANRLLGFTAQQTLDYTQSLYEKKLVTYPRTDSRFLTDDMAASVNCLIDEVSMKFNIGIPISKEVKQIINNSKVTDHHAIVPTKQITKFNLTELGKGEYQVLKLIAMRLLCAVGKPFIYQETDVVLKCFDTLFNAKGKVTLDLGWKQIKEHFIENKKEKEATQLPNLAIGEKLIIHGSEIKEGKTSPPKHFTEDTLLQAMEKASVDEMSKEIERKGIGTPATRAGIIEKLVRIGFIERIANKKVKNLIPTQKGISLITVVPELIQSASMTADWEEKLLGIEKGTYDSKEFMQEIEDMVTGLVKTYEFVKGADVIMNNKKVIGACPHCGSDVIQGQKGYFCTNKECRFVLWKNNAFFSSIGKKLTETQFEDLLRNKRLKLKECQSKKTGKVFNSTVILSTENDGKAKFELNFGKEGEK